MEQKTIVISPAEPPDKTGRQSAGYADVLVCLMAVSVMPIYLYGLQVLWPLFWASVTALICEFVCVKLLGRRLNFRDASGIVTAFITVLLLPATVPVWMPCVSVAISICVAKYPFGGTGKNIFNPAAVGLAFCALCWPDQLLRYPVPFTTQGVTDPSLIQYGTSPASVLQLGGTPKIDYIDVLLGKFPGPMGATCMIVLAACLIYLLCRRRVSPQVIFSTFAVLFLFAVFLPRSPSGERASLIYEFCSGGFVFGVIFMANDPATMPRTGAGQTAYGILLGLLVAILRRFGAVELNIMFALLIANVFVSSCDKYALLGQAKFQQWEQRRREGRVSPRRRGAASGEEKEART